MDQVERKSIERVGDLAGPGSGYDKEMGKSRAERRVDDVPHDRPSLPRQQQLRLAHAPGQAGRKDNAGHGRGRITRSFHDAPRRSRP